MVVTFNMRRLEALRRAKKRARRAIDLPDERKRRVRRYARERKRYLVARRGIVGNALWLTQIQMIQ